MLPFLRSPKLDCWARVAEQLMLHYPTLPFMGLLVREGQGAFGATPAIISEYGLVGFGGDH